VTTPAELGSSDRVILETVLREAPIGVVVLDRELRIDCVSRTAEADGPLTPADAGRSLFEAWRDVPDDVVVALRRVACGRASHVEMRSESPDWRADRMTISAATDAAGVVKHVIWMWSDASGHARKGTGVVAWPRLPRGRW
jgi:PAS fold